MTEHAIREYLQANLSRYLELLRAWVSINSFSGNAAGVDALGKVTAEAFEGLGFEAEHVPSAHAGCGHHVVLTRRAPPSPGRRGDEPQSPPWPQTATGGRKSRPSDLPPAAAGGNEGGPSGVTLGLVSHLDTVFPPEEEAANEFRWRPDGGRIYGPGTVDNKGGTLVLYMVLDGLRAAAPEVFDAATWVVLLDASEESNADDFQALCLERLAYDARACLIFEGGHLIDGAWTVVAARKGMAIYHVMVEGKAAHAGSAHPEGANAIVQLAETIGRIAALTDYEHELTFNVGRVSGGTVTNRVPHRAEAWVEMRAFDTAAFDRGVAAMLALADEPKVRSADGRYGCRVRVEITHQTPPWPRNEATDGLLAVWQAAGRSLDMEVAAEERGGLSDGNGVWQAVPTVDGLGPLGANAHCSEQSGPPSIPPVPSEGHRGEADGPPSPARARSGGGVGGEGGGGKEQEYLLVESLVPKAVLDAVAIMKLL